MLTIGAGIGMLIFGIIALIRGKFTLSKNKVVMGTPARLLGVLAMTPIPLMLGAGVVIGLVSMPQNVEKFQKDNQALFAGVEIGILVVIAGLVFGIGTAIGVSPREAQRIEAESRRRDVYDDDADDEYDDDDEDRPRRKPRRDKYEVVDEDEEEERPRKRSRRDDYDDDDDDHDRPRRRK